MLIRLGFTISLSKSVILPSKNISFLGFDLNSVTMTVTMGTAKVQDIKNFITDSVTRPCLPISTFAALLGKLAATLPANKYGQVFL